MITDESEMVERSLYPLLPVIGPRHGNDVGTIMAAARSGDWRLLDDGGAEAGGVVAGTRRVRADRPRATRPRGRRGGRPAGSAGHRADARAAGGGPRSRGRAPAAGVAQDSWPGGQRSGRRIDRRRRRPSSHSLPRIATWLRSRDPGRHTRARRARPISVRQPSSRRSLRRRARCGLACAAPDAAHRVPSVA